MLIPHMGTKVIPPFDSPIPDAVTSRERAIKAFLEMSHLMVTAQALLCRERGSPGAARFIANILLTEGLWGAGLRLREGCRNRDIIERGAWRSVQLVDGVYRGPKVRGNLRVFTVRVRNLVAQKAGCGALAMIRTKLWTIDREEAITIIMEW